MDKNTTLDTENNEDLVSKFCYFHALSLTLQNYLSSFKS